MKNYWSRRELEAFGEPINPIAPTRLSKMVGGGGKGTVEAPDYKGAAEAQGKSSAEAIKAQTVANRPNIVTPFGTQSWTNNRTFDQAGYDAAMANYNSQMSQARPSSFQPRWVDGGSHDGAGAGYWEMDEIEGNSPNIAMPDRNSFYGEDNWTQTTTLTPETQAALDAQMKIQQGRSDAALGLMPRMNQAINTPIDMSKMQAWGSTPTESNLQNVGAAPGLFQMGNAPSLSRMGNAPSLQTQLDLSGVPKMPGDDNAEFVQQYVNKANDFARPEYELQQSKLDSKLYAMGLTPGSEAWTNAQRELGDQQARNMFQAINVGMNQSNEMYRNQLAANNQGFSQSLGAGNFTNTALQNQNAMNLQNLGFNNDAAQAENQMQLGNLGFNNNALQNQNAMNLANAGFNNNNATTRFNQQLSASNYANQLRQAQYAMAQQEQLQPLNVMNALMTGQQVGMPQMPSFSQAQAAQPVNYLGAANMTGQMAMQNASMQNASDNSMMNGLFNLGGMGMAGAFKFSDKRLKTDIKRIGKLGKLNLYSYRYIGSNARHEGVLAHEVKKVMPEAVQRHASGYDTVNYSMIGA